ncbi:MAG: serine/threonine-protein kinase [Cyanobacteria bacterium P01_G01_bin.54]
MGLAEGQVLTHGKHEYKVLEELGRGRFAITYKVQRTDLSRTPPQVDRKLWVLKILNPEVLASLPEAERDRLEELFRDEATKLVQCRDIPHIVQAERAFKVEDIVCLPMEYVAGRSLADRAEGILSEAVALGYMEQIGWAIAQVHDTVGLVHRDIRPANILLRIVGNTVEPVLTDFGLAMDFDTELTRSRPKERMDGFSPLELYSCGRQPIGPYTDVYSLAATLYELLTQTIPPSAEERKLNGVALLSPQGQNPTISQHVAEAILKGLKLQPGDRPQSVVALLALLEIRDGPDWLEEEIERVEEELERIEAEPESDEKSVNWDKWNVIWMAITAILAAIGMALGIPALIKEFRSEPESSGLMRVTVGRSIQTRPTSSFGYSSREEMLKIPSREGRSSAAPTGVGRVSATSPTSPSTQQRS